MRFNQDIELQNKILEVRKNGMSILDISKMFPQFSEITYKRFLKGTGRFVDSKKMSESCKKGWAKMPYERKRKHEDHLRKLANKAGFSVTGGLRRLLNNIPQYKLVIAIVDVRHGQESLFSDCGFEFVSEKIGSWWIEKEELVSIEKFPDNTGYELGLSKFWDYGQLKYVRKALS